MAEPFLRIYGSCDWCPMPGNDASTYLLDDRIHSAEHIEQLLGLSVLGDIPDCNMSHQKGRYGYYRGKSYGKYGYGPYGHNQKSKKKGGA